MGGIYRGHSRGTSIERRGSVPAVATHSQDTASEDPHSYARLSKIPASVRAVFSSAAQSAHRISGRPTAPEPALPLEQPAARAAWISSDQASGSHESGSERAPVGC